jgi:hypothetical protein
VRSELRAVSRRLAAIERLLAERTGDGEAPATARAGRSGAAEGKRAGGATGSTRASGASDAARRSGGAGGGRRSGGARGTG